MRARPVVVVGGRQAGAKTKGEKGMKTVIFDLDGTLADTSADLIASANYCFREMGLGDLLDPVADAGVAFRGGRAMLALGMARAQTPDAAAQVEAYYPVLLRAYGAAIDVHTRLYPGAIEAVEALKTGGYRVGICTNKPQALAETLMQRLGVRGMFASLVGADTLPQRKPDPAPFVHAVQLAGGAPAQACLIGDTITDRKTAQAAGVPCVLVGFGPDGMGVAQLAPEAIISHYSELPGVVRQLLG